MAEEQIVMIQALQDQMEELRQKGDEVAHLKEQNRKLLQQLGESVREEQSHTSRPPTHPTHQVHQTHHTFPTHPTHQSVESSVFKL